MSDGYYRGALIEIVPLNLSSLIAELEADDARTSEAHLTDGPEDAVGPAQAAATDEET